MHDLFDDKMPWIHFLPNIFMNDSSDDEFDHKFGIKMFSLYNIYMEYMGLWMRCLLTLESCIFYVSNSLEVYFDFNPKQPCFKFINRVGRTCFV